MKTTPSVCLGILLSCVPTMFAASGLYRDGVGAESMSVGGATVADVGAPLNSLAANPAGAGEFRTTTLQLGGVGGVPIGKFSNSANRDSAVQSSVGVWPEGGLGIRLNEDGTLGLAIGFFPESALKARWRYIDPPGGATGTTTYGVQTHKSEFLALRSAVAAGWSINQYVSIGASLGAVYNENTLRAPYVFQTQPALKGAKTLLDLNTTGYGFDGQIGVLAHPTSKLDLGLSYRTPAWVEGHGDASGNVGAQFADLGSPNAPPLFHYDAEVDTELPQIVSAGLAWKAAQRLTLLAQVDWINWGQAFDKLPVILTHGDNPALNALVKADSLEDDTPLRWKDQFVYRAGLDFEVINRLHLRGGYSYGRSPVPTSTLTPLTAAIVEHTLAAGVGYDLGRVRVDLAYQYGFPNTVHVGQSQLRSGEYSNSETEVQLHFLALTVGVRF